MSRAAPSENVLWAPHPGRQELFYTHPANIVGYGGSAGSGKLLDVKTPIPTPTGWTAMGDLVAGNTIFSDTGATCVVLVAHEVEVPECYEIEFDDGSTVLAGEEHLWRTFSAADLAALTRRDDEWRANRRKTRKSRATGLRSAAFTAAIIARNKRLTPPEKAPPLGEIRTTKQIAETLTLPSGRRNHAIKVAGALELPEVDLPLEPYCLGLWLGDGSTNAPVITKMDEEIHAHLRASGFVETSRSKDRTYQRYYGGLLAALRLAGVFGNKHVPAVYLRASRAQRLSLLQGLMDTDGTASVNGNVSFSNTNRRLIDACYELVVSLGWKATIQEKRAKLYGVDHGPYWNVAFNPDVYVFRIPRKRDRQKPDSRRRTSGWRYIVRCDRAAPVPMRCITVDSPSRLYLCGRAMVPTHNTAAMIFHHFYVLDFESQRWMRSEITQSQARGIYFRRLATNLSDAEDTFLRIAPHTDKAGMDGWNASTRTYKYSCGLKYRFAGMEKPRDYMKFLSYQFTDVSFDELTEAEEEQFDYLFTRIRSADPALRPFFRMSWGSNPVGPGLDWVRKRFIAGRKSDVTYIRKIKNADGSIHEISEVFIQAYLKDNPTLAVGGEYEAALRSSKPHIANILLHGDWWAQKGNFLGAFWDSRVHVVKDHKVPRNVFRFRSCDFGIGSHSSITWWYVDTDGCFTAYHNLYLHDMTAPQQADRMREIEKHYGDWNEDDQMSMLNGPLDAQCFKRHGASGPTIAEDFRRKGFPWRPSAKDRFNGLAEVCKRLGARMPRPEHEAGISTSSAKGMIRWMERCKAPIEYLPIIPADENNPGEVMKKYRHLHTLDDTMFACMTRPIRPSKEEDDWDDVEEVKSAWRRKDMRKIASIL